MKNYAEELVYWYLRLQGFLLINDWVHKFRKPINRNGQQHESTYNTDTDIIGVRHKYYDEHIGNCNNNISVNDKLRREHKHMASMEWNEYTINNVMQLLLNNNETLDTVCIVSHVSLVKGINYDEIFRSINTYNGEHLVIGALKRIGIFSSCELVRHTASIMNNKYHQINGITIIKVSVGIDGENCTEVSAYIPISNIIKYVKGHCELWSKATSKETGWDKYPSNLLQYLLKHPSG
ncbi:MAG: hypothetical protein GF403_10250 [Candidatus Coatesbacteria bacterium]|nr:hypothetical protein [Candidatus Coatesbacteria bacterium]